MGLSPNCVHARTPSHGAAGSGARHRNAPTGGAANGIPLKLHTSVHLTRDQSTSDLHHFQSLSKTPGPCRGTRCDFGRECNAGGARGHGQRCRHGNCRAAAGKRYEEACARSCFAQGDCAGIHAGPGNRGITASERTQCRYSTACTPGHRKTTATRQSDAASEDDRSHEEISKPRTFNRNEKLVWIWLRAHGCAGRVSAAWRCHTVIR